MRSYFLVEHTVVFSKADGVHEVRRGIWNLVRNREAGLVLYSLIMGPNSNEALIAGG